MKECHEMNKLQTTNGTKEMLISFFHKLWRAHMTQGVPFRLERPNFAHLKCPNPGGDVKICNIFFGGVQPLVVSADSVSILNSTIFGHKIILKFLLIIGETEISKSKYLAISV